MSETRRIIGRHLFVFITLVIGAVAEIALFLLKGV